jgi:hypothetical protein
MRRKALWLAVGLMLLGIAGMLTMAVVLVQHEPSFYRRAAIPAGTQRTELSKEFTVALANFLDRIRNGGDAQTGDWYGKFDESALNSCLAEDFVKGGYAKKLLPDGISDPRLVLEQDRIRLGFRYGEGPWSTIIAVEFRVWLAKSEQNVVVLELQRLHAGALPISAQSLLQQISEALHNYNIQVTWYRHNGNPTAALKFNTDQPRPTCQIKKLALSSGSLAISGHSSEPLDNPK